LRTLGIILRNNGQSRTVTIEVGGDVRYKKVVSLPAQSKRRVFIYLPNDNISSYTRINVTDMVTGLSKHSYHSPLPGQYDSSVYSPRYILGRLSHFDFPINTVEPWQELGTRLENDKMPDHWRGLTGITALMLNYSELQADPVWWDIVMDWVLMGGVLLIVAPTDLATLDIAALQARIPLQVTLRSNPQPLWQAGLGYIAIVPRAEFAKLDASFLPQLGLDFLPFRKIGETESYHELPREYTSNTAYRLLAEQTGQIPHLSLFLLLLLFAVLIGPWGWYALVKKRGKPFLYLLVVFSGALAFSVSLLAVTFIAEGIEPQGVHNSVRIMDLRANKELIFTQTAIFAPAEYHLDIRTPLESHLFLDDVSGYNDNLAYTAYTDANWQYWQNVMPVRQRRVLGIRQLQQTSGRLLLNRLDNGHLRIENHLYTDLTALHVWDNGDYFEFQRVPRGAQQEASPKPLIGPEQIQLYPQSAETAFELASAVMVMEEPATHVIGFQGLPLEFANQLFDDIQNGKVSNRYFIGTLAQVDSDYALFYQGFLELNTGQHVVAGVY